MSRDSWTPGAPVDKAIVHVKRDDSGSLAWYIIVTIVAAASLGIATWSAVVSQDTYDKL